MTTYDRWALCAGARSQTRGLAQWSSLQGGGLPAAIERIRQRLASINDGNREMVDILNAVLTDRLPAVEAASAEVLSHAVHSADAYDRISAFSARIATLAERL